MRIIDWSSDVCSSDLDRPASATDRSWAPAFAGVTTKTRTHHHAKSSHFRQNGSQGRRDLSCTRRRGRREIGRASWRERVGQYVEISVVAVSSKKKTQG